MGETRYANKGTQGDYTHISFSATVAARHSIRLLVRMHIGREEYFDGMHHL